MARSMSVMCLVAILFLTGCSSDPFIRPPRLSVVGRYGGLLYHQLCILQRLGVQVVEYGDNLRIIILADDLFPPDCYDLRYPHAQEILDNVLIFLHYYHPNSLTITAYSDNVASPSHNLMLTSKQAKAVAGYLWSHGWHFDALDPVGMGHTFPIATNGNSTGSAYNRHIELNMPVVR